MVVSPRTGRRLVNSLVGTITFLKNEDGVNGRNEIENLSPVSENSENPIVQANRKNPGTNHNHRGTDNSYAM
jgi:hypothetical protein